MSVAVQPSVGVQCDLRQESQPDVVDQEVPKRGPPTFPPTLHPFTIADPSFGSSGEGRGDLLRGLR